MSAQTHSHNQAPSSLFEQLDESRISRFHWLTVITAGMGFFTDAYDLFIIGTVTAILTPIWHLSTGELSLLNSISLIASVLGALVFGKLMDVLGRKAMYGVEVSLLTLGALLSAFSWSFWALFGFRILVGIGVGGDYATSAVISSEYANRKDRGRLVGTVFAMQGFGLLAGPAVASILLGAGVSHALAWRVMLALGAVPAASVIYLRRRIKETPRYTLAVKGDIEATEESVRWVTGEDHQSDQLDSAHSISQRVNVSLDAVASWNTSAKHDQHVVGSSVAGNSNGAMSPGAVQGRNLTNYRRAKLTNKPFLMRLVGTAGSWFLMDIAFYGNSISSPLILKALQPHGSLLDHIMMAGAIFLVAALPGYWLAVGLMDRIGRKRIQWQGFLIMALTFAAIAAIPGVTKNAWAFLLLFGVSYFFVEFGPNETTFIYPAEVFPTSIRGAGDGISAAGGKVGAFLGALMVPHLLQLFGISGVMGVMAGVSLIGALLTLVALPEPKHRSLEDVSREDTIAVSPPVEVASTLSA